MQWSTNESKHQYPDVRPQGIDYCPCFVMDARSLHSRTEWGMREICYSYHNKLWHVDNDAVLRYIIYFTHALSPNNPSLSVRHHHGDGVTVSHTAQDSRRA